jgi:hypothetical protein
MSDDLEPLVDALRRQLKDRTRRLEELEDRVAELEELVDPDPGGTAYEQLTRDQKIHRVRVALLEQATAGRAPTMSYDDVQWLFDGKPSPGHAYDLMELAAEADGYTYETGGHGSGKKRIRVEPDGVNDERVIHAANKGSDGVGA